MNNLILIVKNLSIKLRKTGEILVKNASFDLHPGDVMRISGLNGCGKSTILKVLHGSTSDYICEGEVVLSPFGECNILKLSDNDILRYRKFIGYVPQKDEYEGLNKLTISDLIQNEIHGSEMTFDEASELFEQYLSDGKRITLKSIPGKLSGGQQRMLSIFLGLLCGGKHNLMIIDEPLNNLDFENAMKISDLINAIRLKNPDSAMIMVTHCKIITCINREREIADGTIQEVDSTYSCNHCMGAPDCELFYNKINLK